MKNRTYRYSNANTLYPFGYGLTYSRVVYRNSTVNCEVSGMMDRLTLTTEVQNEGAYLIHESVQAYVKLMDAPEEAPGYQLKGIASVELKPGEKKKVEITLEPRDFATITEEGKCVILPGEYVVSIGGQQPDILSANLTGLVADTFHIVKSGMITEVEY